MKDKKQAFKKKVLGWLASENVDISNRKVRVYNTLHYGLEVRLYSDPIELTNHRRSFRKTHKERNYDGSITVHGMYGVFSRKISLYTAISEKDFENEEVLKLTLDLIRGM